MALREQVGADRREDEVAERTSDSQRSTPSLLGLDRRGGGIELLRLEPFDPRVPVSELPAPLSVVEVVEQELDLVRAEAERGEPRAGLLRLHAA